MNAMDTPIGGAEHTSGKYDVLKELYGVPFTGEEWQQIAVDAIDLEERADQSETHNQRVLELMQQTERLHFPNDEASRICHQAVREAAQATFGQQFGDWDAVRAFVSQKSN